MSSTPAAFVPGARTVPMAAPDQGRGVSVGHNDQDATTGFSTWSPPD